LQLTYQTFGSPANPPLALMHGFMSCADHWAPNLPALSARHWLILAELPGHGACPAPTDPAAYCAAALVAGLEAVRAAIGAPRWALCGQSFGAGVTLRYALTHPERVSAQIFTNGNAALRAPLDTDALAENLVRAHRLRLGGQEDLRRQPMHPRFAKRFPPDLRRRLSDAADRADTHGLSLLLEHVTPELSVHAEFARTSVPTLLINGRHERRFQRHRDWAAATLPGLEVADIDGGHSVNIENPAGFDAAALAFLARHRP
jgi:2-succinyl-6-hydroxy-2,4-cyclohexadiene-1-carboxylate synthase